MSRQEDPGFFYLPLFYSDGCESKPETWNRRGEAQAGRIFTSIQLFIPICERDLERTGQPKHSEVDLLEQRLRRWGRDLGERVTGKGCVLNSHCIAGRYCLNIHSLYTINQGEGGELNVFFGQF